MAILQVETDFNVDSGHLVRAVEQEGGLNIILSGPYNARGLLTNQARFDAPDGFGDEEAASIADAIRSAIPNSRVVVGWSGGRLEVP